MENEDKMDFHMRRWGRLVPIL